MAFFFGDYEQTIDAKRRLSIVSQLRDLVDVETDGSAFILFLSPDGHLWLYPDQYYKRLIATIRQSPLPSKNQRKAALFFAMARPIRCDGQGRVVLPEKSMERANITSKVTLVGNNDHIEIWPRKEWESYLQRELPLMGERLEEFAPQFAPDATTSPGQSLLNGYIGFLVANENTRSWIIFQGILGS